MVPLRLLSLSTLFSCLIKPLVHKQRFHFIFLPELYLFTSYYQCILYDAPRSRRTVRYLFAAGRTRLFSILDNDRVFIHQRVHILFGIVDAALCLPIFQHAVVDRRKFGQHGFLPAVDKDEVHAVAG